MKYIKLRVSLFASWLGALELQSQTAELIMFNSAVCGRSYF